MIDVRPLEDVVFRFRYVRTTLEGAPDLYQVVTGVEGLSATVAFYAPGESSPMTGLGAVVAGEIEDGWYSATLPIAEVSESGLYRGVITTTDTTVDVRVMSDGAYIDLALDASDESWALDPTFANLLILLAKRLNDEDHGKWPVNDKAQCLNVANRETCVVTDCNKTTTTIAIVAGQTDYDCSPIYRPVEVALDGISLKGRTLGAAGISLAVWDATDDGVPEEYLPMTGSVIRLGPAAPIGTGDSPPTSLVVYGPAYPDALTEGTDRPSAIPGAHAVAAILERAEAEAIDMRKNSGSLEYYKAKMANWKTWCDLIADATGKGG